MSSRTGLYPLCLATAVHLGCAAPRQATWDDTAAVEVRGTLHVPPKLATIDDEDARSSGVLIDDALVAFTADRARARAQGPTSPLWQRSWIGVLDAVDNAVTRAPVAPDLGAFVRARATLEMELQADRERGALLPADVDKRLTTTLMSVDESVQELRAANAPGTLAPSPRLEEGELVLRAPLSPMQVSSPFGRRHDPFTGSVRYHAGVDLSASEGTAVFTSATGVVVYAGLQGGYGRYIVVDHGEGVRTHYAHLSAIRTEVGALVIEGDVIGAVGSTGRSTGPHLHFAVTDNVGAFLDPLAVLDLPFASLAGQVATKP
jgi:murein DD-endopeptidase MepM/ murein hydrolase activator NlpD